MADGANSPPSNSSSSPLLVRRRGDAPLGTVPGTLSGSVSGTAGAGVGSAVGSSGGVLADAGGSLAPGTDAEGAPQAAETAVEPTIKVCSV